MILHKYSNFFCEKFFPNPLKKPRKCGIITTIYSHDRGTYETQKTAYFGACRCDDVRDGLCACGLRRRQGARRSPRTARSRARHDGSGARSVRLLRCLFADLLRLRHALRRGELERPRHMDAGSDRSDDLGRTADLAVALRLGVLC